MSLESDMYTALLADSTLASMIGSRLVPQPPKGLPQGHPLPAITYQRVSTVREYIYGSPSGRLGLARTRMQFNIFGRSLLESRAITDALIGAIDNLPMDSRVEGPRDMGSPDASVSFPSLDAVLVHHEAV